MRAGRGLRACWCTGKDSGQRRFSSNKQHTKRYKRAYKQPAQRAPGAILYFMPTVHPKEKRRRHGFAAKKKVLQKLLNDNCKSKVYF